MAKSKKKLTKHQRELALKFKVWRLKQKRERLLLAQSRKSLSEAYENFLAQTKDLSPAKLLREARRIRTLNERIQRKLKKVIGE